MVQVDQILRNAMYAVHRATKCTATVRYTVALRAINNAHLHLSGCDVPEQDRSYIAEVCGKKGWPIRRRNQCLG